MNVYPLLSGKKVQPFYILHVLKKHSKKGKRFTQDDIVEELNKMGYKSERKSVANDLKMLINLGYKIHGVEPEFDEKTGEELPITRGKIWIEGDLPDEQLSWLLTVATYNVNIDKTKKEELLNNIIALGSSTFRETHNAKSILNGGRIYQFDNTYLLDTVSKIEEAKSQGKKVRFKYVKLKRNTDKLVVENEKEYTVSPYWVVQKNGNTYLICYNHAENRIWNCRVDKIKNVEIIKSYSLPKTETTLKGVSVGEYVAQHPNMFTGEPIAIELKVDKSRIGLVYDAFSSYTLISEEQNTVTLKVLCGELDMFYWAVQYGGFVEVVSPQKLRNDIREHVEKMSARYNIR